MARSSILLGVLLLALAGCAAKHSLVGSWRVMPSESTSIAVFNSDGTMEMKDLSGKFTLHGNYSVDGSNLTMKLISPMEFPTIHLTMQWDKDELHLKPGAGTPYVGMSDLALRRLSEKEVEDLTKQGVAGGSRQAGNPWLGTGQQDSPQSQASTCMNNMKQAAVASIMYAQDNDEVLPTGAWVDNTTPYVKNQAIFTCPARVKQNAIGGYGFATALVGKSIASIPSPATETLIYETNREGLNVVEDGTQEAPPARHDNRIFRAYGDGHVKVKP